MKRFLIISFSFFILLSCESESTNVYEDVNLDRELIVNIEYIKSISEKGFTSFDMEEVYGKSESFIKIEDELTVKAIEESYVDGDTNWIVYSQYYGLQAFQWDIIKNNFCFTFFKQDEECCLTQYCVVSNQEGGIKSIGYFGTVGGDGGWRTNTKGVITHPGTYHIFEDDFEIDYEGDMEIEIQTHTEHYLRFQDSLFIKGEIINDYTMSDTTEMMLGC